MLITGLVHKVDYKHKFTGLHDWAFWHAQVECHYRHHHYDYDRICGWTWWRSWLCDSVRIALPNADFERVLKFCLDCKGVFELEFTGLGQVSESEQCVCFSCALCCIAWTVLCCTANEHWASSTDGRKWANKLQLLQWHEANQSKHEAKTQTSKFRDWTADSKTVDDDHHGGHVFLKI